MHGPCCDPGRFIAEIRARCCFVRMDRLPLGYRPITDLGARGPVERGHHILARLPPVGRMRFARAGDGPRCQQQITVGRGEFESVCQPLERVNIWARFEPSLDIADSTRTQSSTFRQRPCDRPPALRKRRSRTPTPDVSVIAFVSACAHADNTLQKRVGQRVNCV